MVGASGGCGGGPTRASVACEELRTLIRVERTPENEAQTSWAVALLYRCFAASTLAFRFALARLGNPLSGREHTSSIVMKNSLFL